jgi:hypothetical protein
VRHRHEASTGRRFRSFVAARNRQLLCEKWGDVLAEQEPPGDSPEAVARALARAEERAQGFRLRPAAVPRERRAAPAFDPLLQERLHLERDLALQWAYAEHLAQTLDEAEAAGAFWRDAATAGEPMEEGRKRRVSAAEELAHLRARDMTLDAVERGRWWRLYLRLLPLLRRLR